MFQKFEVIKRFYQQKLLSLNQTFFVGNDFGMIELIFEIDNQYKRLNFCEDQILVSLTLASQVIASQIKKCF